MERVRDWPKLSASVRPTLMVALGRAARERGYSLSEAVRLLLERDGLSFVRKLTPRDPRAENAAYTTQEGGE